MHALPRSLLAAVLLASLTSCTEYPEEIDLGAVCISAADQPDGDALILVTANSEDCSADHEGASFRCSITADGDRLHVQTVFQDGKDPDDSCGRGPQTAECELIVSPGTYTIEFDGMTEQLDVPDGEGVCLPPGTDPEEW